MQIPGTRGGSKAELARRINAHIAATATTSDEAGDPDCCDCAVAAEVEYGDEDEMRADTAVVLQTELEQELEVDTRTDGKVSRRGYDRPLDRAERGSNAAP